MKPDILRSICRLSEWGLEPHEVRSLVRISRTLSRWHEAECGMEWGYIYRDETTNRPVRVTFHGEREFRYRVRDMETGALDRLETFRAAHPSLFFYVQTDPRGASLYIGRQADLQGPVDSCYNSGLGLYW